MSLRRRTVTLRPELGPMRFVANDHALVSLHFVDEDVSTSDEHHDVLDRAVAEVDEYLAGKRTAFAIPLAPEGTPFQREVWERLRAIPFGETRSYEDIARGLGKPTAMRAVGSANGKNPIGIVVPCHRVIGKDGSLTGYAGGIERKAFLLELERRSS